MRAAVAALTLACASLILSGCATSGVAGAALAADSEIRALGRRALAGDEQAQLELGIRYEEGRGVPVDLGRARDLYFDAATRPSGDRVSTYVATPGGAVSSFVRTVPAGSEYSGNSEALLRWHRLLSRPAQRSAVAPAAAPLPVPAGRMESPDDRVDALHELVDVNGYQPIFNGLKSRRAPWRQTILETHGARFATPRSVADSMLFILDPPGPYEVGKPIGADRIRAFCAANAGPEQGYDGPHRRLAGLCALADCGLVSHRQWAGLGRSVTAAPDRQSGAPSARDHDAAEDAAFLFRAAAICGERGVARQLIPTLRDYARRISGLRATCPRETCENSVDVVVRRALAVDAQLLLAQAESDLLPAELAMAAARHWLDSRAVVAPLDTSVDRQIAALCARAHVPETECRRDFPHSYFLEQHFLADRARALAAAGPGADPCLAIRAFRTRFALETDFRFSPANSPGPRLIFAARCFPRGDLS